MDLIRLSETNREFPVDINELEERLFHLEDRQLCKEEMLLMIENSIRVNIAGYVSQNRILREELSKSFRLLSAMSDQLAFNEETVIDFLNYQRVYKLIRPEGGFQYKDYCVYLVIDSDLKVAKIGMSGNLKQRIADMFITGEVYYTIFNSKQKAMDYEKLLLEEFKDSLISKEYLSIPLLDMDKIKSRFEIQFKVDR